MLQVPYPLVQFDAVVTHSAVCKVGRQRVGWLADAHAAFFVREFKLGHF